MKPICGPSRFSLVLPSLRAFALAGAVGAVLTNSATAADFVHTIEEGDNPWNLTERYLKSFRYWQRLQEYNRIVDANALRPGTKLRIPEAWLKAEPAFAQVVDARGNAEAVHDGHTSALVAGSEIGSGTLIRTGDASSVVIEFPDGSRTQLGANGELQLGDVRQVVASGAQQVHIKLNQGSIDNSVESTARAGGRYLIQTPAAVAAVRGTEFRIGVADDGMRAETLHGGVDVRNSRGSVRVNGGQGTVARAGARPARVSTLLPAPALDGIPQIIDRIPFRFPIAAVAGATRYRTQVLSSDAAAIVTADFIGAQAAAQALADLPDGNYRLRMRAVDEKGLEGIDAERDIVIDARPEPPFPQRPAPGARAVDERVAFAWARSTDAGSYHFQLARDEGFRDLLVDRAELSDAGFTHDAELAPGPYFWRVARRNAEEGKGPFSDPQNFVRPPPGPAAEPPEISADTLVLRWRAGGESERYQVQFARAADFAAPVIDLETETAALEIAKPPPASYYVRIRSLPADTTPGPWGKPQLVDVPENPWHPLLIFAPLLLLAL